MECYAGRYVPVCQRYLLPSTWETTGFSDTSVVIYWTASHHIPENSAVHSPCLENGFNLVFSFCQL